VSSALNIPPICPYCNHDVSIGWGNSNGLPRHRCKSCQKTFNALTGIPLSGLRHRECWSEYAQCLLEGATIRQAAQRCGINKDTSFRWRHRFLNLPAKIKATSLHGIVEADETFFLESRKGERDIDRPPRKRGGKAKKPGTSKEQIPVLIARDRSAATMDVILQKANIPSILSALAPVVDSDAVLCSDGNSIYKIFAEKYHIEHKPVNISAGIRVREHAYHIQNVNAYTSRLKGWMRRFHGVATKYLENYLGWRRCLEQLDQNLTPEIIIKKAAYGYQQTTHT